MSGRILDVEKDLLAVEKLAFVEVERGLEFERDNVEVIMLGVWAILG